MRCKVKLLKLSALCEHKSLHYSAIKSQVNLYCEMTDGSLKTVSKLHRGPGNNGEVL